MKAKAGCSLCAQGISLCLAWFSLSSTFHHAFVKTLLLKLTLNGVLAWLGRRSASVQIPSGSYARPVVLYVSMDQPWFSGRVRVRVWVRVLWRFADTRWRFGDFEMAQWRFGVF